MRKGTCRRRLNRMPAPDARLPYVKMLLATLGLTLVTSAIMVPIRWNGQRGVDRRPEIDTLLDVMIVLSAFVFWMVMVMLAYALWSYRAKPGDESDGEPIHGNTRLEIAWTLIPTVIVLFGAVYSWIVLDEIEEKESDRMVVDVYAQQFAWNFTYPEENKYSPGAPRPGRPPDRVQDARARRPPLLLGARVADQAGRRARASARAIVTPDRSGPTSSSAPSSAARSLDDAGGGDGEAEAEFERWLRRAGRGAAVSRHREPLRGGGPAPRRRIAMSGERDAVRYGLCGTPAKVEGGYLGFLIGRTARGFGLVVAGCAISG